MKFCEKCGDEIDTRDGDNRCEECEREIANKKKRSERNRRARLNRAARHEAMESVGMKRVRGAMGGVYYE